MKAIILTKGRIAAVDDEDFDRVNQFSWYAQKSPSGVWYAYRNIWRAGENTNDHQSMHHFVSGIKPVDHRNGDGLDNRKENLRAATKSQNGMAKRRKGKSATSQFRGVYFEAQTQKWRAKITVNDVTIPLGRFTAEDEAARAYDKAAREHFKEFAAPNFLT